VTGCSRRWRRVVVVFVSSFPGEAERTVLILPWALSDVTAVRSGSVRTAAIPGRGLFWAEPMTLVSVFPSDLVFCF